MFGGEGYFAWLESVKADLLQVTQPIVRAFSETQCACCGGELTVSHYWCSDHCHQIWQRSRSIPQEATP